MSSHFRWFAALVLMTMFANDALADAGPPCLVGLLRRDNGVQRRPFVDAEYELVIVSDPNVKEAELRVPRRMLIADASTGGSTRTAMVGLALSAAFVGGGLWCLRFRGSKIPKQKLIAAGALGVLLVGSLVFVSIGHAKAQPQVFPRIVQLGDTTVKVQIVEQGDAVQLVVPTELADKIAAR